MTDAVRRHRPALLKLTADQQSVVDDLEDGLASRTAVVEWLQRVSVRTLGRLPDAWYTAMAMRPDWLDNLTGASRGPAIQRDLVADRVLLPACHDAYRELRRSAHEYVDQSDGDPQPPDPERQEFLAMRPSLEELDTTQRLAVQDALDGFTCRREVREWTQDLVTATEGYIPREFASAACYAPRVFDPLTDAYSGSNAKQRAACDRETILARHVLPRMNAGVRDLQQTAGETAYEQPSGLEIPQG